MLGGGVAGSKPGVGSGIITAPFIMQSTGSTLYDLVLSICASRKEGTLEIKSNPDAGSRC